MTPPEFKGSAIKAKAKATLKPFQSQDPVRALPEARVEFSFHAENGALTEISGDYLLPFGADLLQGKETKMPVTYRARELWNDNCLELFWGFVGSPSYLEFNLSLAGSSLGAWSLYQFNSYRRPDPPQDCHQYELVLFSLEQNLHSIQGEPAEKPQGKCLENLRVRFLLRINSKEAADAFWESSANLKTSALELNPTLIWGQPREFFAAEQPSAAKRADFHLRPYKDKIDLSQKVCP